MPIPVAKGNISNFHKVGSLVHSLFNRETGFPCFIDPSGWLDRQITQQLVYSRAPGEDKPTQPEYEPLDAVKNSQQSSGQNMILHKKMKSKSAVPPITLKVSNWTKAILTPHHLPKSRDRKKTKRQVNLIDECLMITEPLNNQLMRNVFMPNTSGIGKNFVWKYGLLDDSEEDWLSSDEWYVTDVTTAVDKKGQIVVPRRSATLFVLREKRLLLYDLETGIKMDELCLSSSSTSEIKYSDVHVDLEEELVYVAAETSSLPSELQYEFIVLSYPPLNILYRVQILKSAVTALGEDVIIDVDTTGTFLYIARSSLKETCSLKDLIRMNENSIVNEGSGLEEKTIKVNNFPPVLYSIETSDSYQEMIPHIWPPHVIGKVEDGFEIFSMQHPEQPIYKIPKDNESKIIGKELTLEFYDGHAPQIVLQNLHHGFDILDVKSSQIVRRTFTTKDINDRDTQSLMEQNEATTGRNARGLRNVTRKKYFDADSSKDYGFGYCFELDLFAVVIASSQDETIEVSLYDNFTKKLFKKLQPVLLRPKNKSSDTFSLEVELLSVHFQWSNIMIEVKICTDKDSNELYTLNLMAEGISLLK